MQAFLSALGALLNDPKFWQAVLVVVAGVVFAPNGVAKQVIAGLGAWLDQRAKKVLPQAQYEYIARVLAPAAVTYAWQAGSAYGWDNQTKADKAIAQLLDTVEAHGFKAFADSNILRGIIEATWAQVKPQIIGQAAVTAAVQATLPQAVGAGASVSIAAGTTGVIDDDGVEHAPTPGGASFVTVPDGTPTPAEVAVTA